MYGVIPTQPFTVGSGEARFDRQGDSITLYINDVPSSQWFLSDPGELEFEYMRWMIAAIGSVFPTDQRLSALHLGAAACSLPRAIAHLWPRSRHLAVELDPVLADIVRQHVTLPRAPVLRIRVADAVPTLLARPSSSHDLIICDAFDADMTTPVGLLDDTAAAAAARVLKPGGLYLANLADTPGLPNSHRQIRTLARHFAYTGFITEPAQLRGRRLGNVVVLARHIALDATQDQNLSRKLAADGFPARLVAGGDALLWAGLGRGLDAGLGQGLDVTGL
ncbi:MAG: fused MFS/spermidine synthase [Bifidobacteriaceae bacterium]|jgi:spermidine synthase|nr:fused MFS/spermidine synthase [Bifidobacteriaceae bacterium]